MALVNRMDDRRGFDKGLLYRVVCLSAVLGTVCGTRPLHQLKNQLITPISMPIAINTIMAQAAVERALLSGLFACMVPASSLFI
jgi:hypothetical protein